MRLFLFAAIRLGPVLYTGPEILVIHIKLIPENAVPQARAIGAPVHRMRDPRPQDAPIVKMQRS